MSMLAGDDIPDRCVVIATLRLPTGNPTIFDQHYADPPSVATIGGGLHQHRSATLLFPNVSSMKRPIAPVRDVIGQKLVWHRLD